MEKTYTEEKTFKKFDFKNNPLTNGEYDNCKFVDCDFSDVDLSYCKFTDCEFSGCNLSLIKMVKTAFQDVKFRDCKMLGLHFDSCNEFGLSFSFENCILNLSSFYKTKIKKHLSKIHSYRKWISQNATFQIRYLTIATLSEQILTILI